jgi:hypothetical protein
MCSIRRRSWGMCGKPATQNLHQPRKSQITPSTCPFVITWRHFDGTESECRALLRAVTFGKKRELCIVEAIDETLRIPMIAASPALRRADRHQRAELLPWRALDRRRTIPRHPIPRSSRQSNKTAQPLCELRSIPRCCQCRPVTTAERGCEAGARKPACRRGSERLSVRRALDRGFSLFRCSIRLADYP